MGSEEMTCIQNKCRRYGDAKRDVWKYEDWMRNAHISSTVWYATIEDKSREGWRKFFEHVYHRW